MRRSPSAELSRDECAAWCESECAGDVGGACLSCEFSRSAGIPGETICTAVRPTGESAGESAGEPIYAVLLLGLGLRTLSLTASGIPALKQVVRAVTIKQCEQIAKKAISLDSETEVAAYLRDQVRTLVPEAFRGYTDDR